MRILGLALSFIAWTASAQIIVPNDRVIKLDGEWNLVLFKYLSLDETAKTPSTQVKVPDSWNGTIWENETFSGIGYGTYFLHLKLPKSNNDIILHMPPVGMSYRVYIDETLIGQLGKPGKETGTTSSQIGPRTFRIPNQFLGKEVSLIIHVANFEHQNGGLWYSPSIGTAEDLKEKEFRSIVDDLVVLGSILIIMAYHFFIFVLRPKEGYSFYFAMLCFCLALHITTQADLSILFFFPDVSWKTVFTLAYSSLILLGPLNLSFIQKLYPRLVPQSVSNPVLAVSSILAAVVWFIPTTISYYFVAPFQLLIVIIGLYLMGVLTVAARQSLSGARILIVGFSFTFITAINDILNSQFLIESTSIIHYGVFVYILTLSIVLAKKFVRFINANERLRFELKSLNEDLEKRVEERTIELQSKEELVQEKNIKLEQANDELNQLMTILAHDLKSPLLNINSLSQMMKDKIDESLIQSNELMQKIATDGVSMIDSLISLKKLEDEDLSNSFSPFDLTKVLNLKVQEFKSQAESKEQKLISSVQEGIEMVSSERHIVQVVDNLLSNAIKFSSSGAEVKLFMKKENDQIKISIEDKGPGFSELDKQKIFGKFQRLSARPTGNETSSGLGLSIVKLLIEKLNGEISLESEKDKGASFSIIFPA